MNDVLINILLPGDEIERLSKKAEIMAAVREAPTEFDFIEHYYGRPDMTHRWNEFQIKPSVVDSIMVDSGR